MSLQRVSGKSKDRIQNRLLMGAVGFVMIAGTILSLAPTVRLHSWEADLRWQHWIGITIWLTGFLILNRLSTKRLPDRDPFLLPLAAILSGWGLVTIFRLDEGLGLRQSLWLGISLLVSGDLISRKRILVILRHYKYVWLLLGLGLTGLTFIFGTYPGGEGPRLWLGSGGVYLQPSEPLKFLLIAYLAAYLADRLPLGFGLIQLSIPTLIMGGSAVAVLISQRDLGTAMLFIMLYTAMLFTAYGRRRIILISATVVLLAGWFGYQEIGIIRTRVDSWLNLWADPGGSSFQVIQSLISIASGGVFGTGIGLGSPGVVPIAYSDFIFSSISEETGLLGMGGLLLLMGLLWSRGLIIAVRSTTRYQKYLSAGLTFFLSFQAFIIIAGNMAVLPLTGVTLPFMSYGGSSLVTVFVALTILLVVSSQKTESETRVEVRTFRLAGAAILGMVVILAGAALWWGVIKSGELQTRTDNPRWAIGSRFVPRGQIVDHNNLALVYTTGVAGDYRRVVSHPELGPVIGYAHPRFGLAGLEASLDGYLRGLQATPASTVILQHLLYAQTPPGNTIRLSLDLAAQRRADNLLAGKQGALVLINAKTGEIYAMSSHPNFDPNTIDQNWDAWMKAEKSVFINRAVQGVYPPGTTIGPFLLASALAESRVPASPDFLSASVSSQALFCARPVTATNSWAQAIAYGCPGASLSLANQLPAGYTRQLYSTLGFDTSPTLPLQVSLPLDIQKDNGEELVVGITKGGISPLQMALAAAMLSSGGSQPSARLVSAVETPNQGWVAFAGETAVSKTLAGATEAARTLQIQNMPIWGATAMISSKEGKITWYIAGSLPDWKGTPLALAVLLEEDNPALAEQIAISMLRSMVEPK